MLSMGSQIVGHDLATEQKQNYDVIKMRHSSEKNTLPDRILSLLEFVV